MHITITVYVTITSYTMTIITDEASPQDALRPTDRILL